MTLSSIEVDKAIKALFDSHLAEIGADELYEKCVIDGFPWPCETLIQATISLKLSAIAQILSADQAAIIGSMVNGAQGNAKRLKGT